MMKERGLIAAAIVAAAAMAASPSLAQGGPGGPAIDRDGPGERFAPMNDMPMMGGGMAELNHRIARLLAAEATHQRAIGARMALSRMMHHMAARLRSMDRNDDGEITEREFLGGMLEIFDRIDGNGDGVIGPGEIRHAFAAFGETETRDRNAGPGGERFDGPPGGMFGNAGPRR